MVGQDRRGEAGSGGALWAGRVVTHDGPLESSRVSQQPSGTTDVIRGDAFSTNQVRPCAAA